MIRSFKSKDTEELFERGRSKRLPSEIWRRAHAKLLILDAAETLDDLRSPPSNHLEALSGDRKGQYSIRVNQRWRICFVWESGNVLEVEIVDYH